MTQASPHTQNTSKPRLKVKFNPASEGDFFCLEQKTKIQNLALLILSLDDNDQRTGYANYHLSKYHQIMDVREAHDYDKAIEHLTKASIGLICARNFDETNVNIDALSDQIDCDFKDFSRILEFQALHNARDSSAQLFLEALSGSKAFVTDLVDSAIERHKNLPTYMKTLMRETALN